MDSSHALAHLDVVRTGGLSELAELKVKGLQVVVFCNFGGE